MSRGARVGSPIEYAPPLPAHHRLAPSHGSIRSLSIERTPCKKFPNVFVYITYARLTKYTVDVVVLTRLSYNKRNLLCSPVRVSLPMSFSNRPFFPFYYGALLGCVLSWRPPSWPTLSSSSSSILAHPSSSSSLSAGYMSCFTKGGLSNMFSDNVKYCSLGHFL